MALRLPLRLRKADEALTIECVTENLSATGFYCHAKEAFAPGDRLECVLFLWDMGSQGATIRWRCDAKVTRVEPAGEDSEAGIGCQIDNYVLLLGQS